MVSENKTEFEILCDKVFKIDDTIRSVRVINTRGKLEAGGMKKGLERRHGSYGNI